MDFNNDVSPSLFRSKVDDNNAFLCQHHDYLDDIMKRLTRPCRLLLLGMCDPSSPMNRKDHH